eukprot:g12720.t1
MPMQLEIPEARFTGRLKAPCAAAQLPQISRSLSELCHPTSSPMHRGKRVPSEWVGGVQRWRFCLKDEPQRGNQEQVKTCAQAMHPLTAQRWDRQARSAEELELKRYGYHRNLPRTRGGPNAQSRFKELVPPEQRANGDSFDPPQVRALAAEGREARRKVKLETLGHIRVLRYEDAAVFVM